MKKEYQSKYTDGLVTAAQYLVDTMLERIALKEKEVLPRKYWRLDKWSKHFKRQIVAANKLLKDYTCQQIIKALNSPRGKNIYSLGLEKPLREIIDGGKKQKENEPLIIKRYNDPDEMWADLDQEAIDRELPKKKSVWEELS